MSIRVNLDVMLARRKMSVTELSNQIGITMANISILKNGRRAPYVLTRLTVSAAFWTASQATFWNIRPTKTRPAIDAGRVFVVY